MNCNTPTDICFSFAGFQKRGGLTDHHSDGWGIAFFEGRGCRLFIDPKASSTSPVAELVKHYPIRSRNVVAHIRKATQGSVSLENTHPFMRELWGLYWIFAHNGNLKGFDPKLDGAYLPVGTTDSERAFCWMLQRLRAAFPNGWPGTERLFKHVAALTSEIGRYGEFNFLLSSGHWLLAHAASRLSYIVRRAPFSSAHLKDQDLTLDFSEIASPDDRVAVVATSPLTDNEVWTPIPRGNLMLFEEGVPMASQATGVGCDPPPGCRT